MGRLAHGGRIDRERPLRFQFNGRTLGGFAGDSLASALLANDVAVVGRSFKYHRPRGIMAAGVEDPSGLVQLGVGAATEPNSRATQIELFDGLVAMPQNCWPSVSFDLQSAIDRVHALVPPGFYYKTFMWPRWGTFEGLIRRSAGLGRAPEERDPDTYTHRYAHCDLLIVGAGPSGLAAADAAAASGARIVLVDDQPEPGGSLLWRGTDPNRLAELLASLSTRPNVQLLTRTSAVGYYDHNLVVLSQRLPEPRAGAAPRTSPRERLWQMRARRVLIAAGAVERPLVFPDNDRPGVMLADSALQFLRRYAVTPGRRAVLFANNDDAYGALFALADAGVEIAGAVDVRAGVAANVEEGLARRGIRLFAQSVIGATRGRTRVHQVVTRALRGDARGVLDADLVLMSGGWAPNVHLFSHAGGGLRFDAEQTCFRPARTAQAVLCIGAANGVFDPVAAQREAGEAARGAVAADVATWPADSVVSPPAASPIAIEPFWRVPAALGGGRQWVDFQNDVTADDVALAAQESFVSVEHLKRYTTSGMATDQGKTSNVNALAILAQETGRDIASVGTTTFRPPFVPTSLGSIAGRYVGELYRAARLLPANDCHVGTRACLADYGGWMRPEAYPRAGEAFDAAVEREVLAVRKGVGLFDASSLGKIEVAGPDAEKFLDHMFVTRIEGMGVRRIRYVVMANEQGIVLDDGVVTRLDADRYWVGASSAHATHVSHVLDEWLQCEWPAWRVSVTDATRQWATFALAGARARDVLEAAGTDIELSAAVFAHMSVRDGRVAGVTARVARVSFCGELQFEIHVPAGYAAALWERLMSAGAQAGIEPVGMEAWLRLRLEKGYPIVGIDTDGTTIPDDLAPMPWRKKAANFVGRRSLDLPSAVRHERQQLIGLEALDGRRLPVGAQILPSKDATPPCASIGRITSSALSATLGRSVALALLAGGRDRVGQSVCAYFGGERYAANVVALPFYDASGTRLNA